MNAGPPRIFSKLFENRCAVGFADVRDVGFIQKLSRNRRRLDGTGWVGDACSPGTSEARHVLLGDVEERLAGFAVKQEDVARLRHLRHGVDRFAFSSDRHEVRIDRQIVVPQVVPQRLEVPDALAGPGVERDRAVRKQIIAVAVAAVEVEGGRPQAGEDQAAT